MAFPLAPAVDDRHTEAGVNYIWTIANTWDVDVDGQELIESTVDPVEGVDVAAIGTVWRNTTDGSAWQYEGSNPGFPLVGVPQPLVNTGAASFDNLVFSTTAIPSLTWRQSFVLPNASTITTVNNNLILGFIGGAVGAGTITAFIYEGADNAQPDNSPIASLTQLGPLALTSDPLTFVGSGATPGVNFEYSFNFATPALLQPGTYTVVFESNINTQYNIWAKADSIQGNYGNNVGSADDFNFEVQGVAATGGTWVPIVKDATIQTTINPPTLQPSQEGLIAGDLWVSRTVGQEGTLYYWDGAAWQPVFTFYDNTIQNFLVGNNHQLAIDELDNIIDRLEAGIQFIGSYDVVGDLADYTVSSGFTDGALPVAADRPNSLLLIISQGTGTGNAPAVDFNRGDFLVSDGVTWSRIAVGTALSTFLEAIDTPTSYLNQAGLTAFVNAAETGIEFKLKTDTHTYVNANAPGTRPNTDPLEAGDQWQESDTGREHFYDGAAWQEQVYVDVNVSTPTTTRDGYLWYHTTTGTLYIYDATAASFVAI